MSDGPFDYLIFSHEHAGWWGPGGCGYTSKLSGAGRYARSAALQICAQAIAGAGHTRELQEVPVREEDAIEFQRMHTEMYGTIWDFLA